MTKSNAARLAEIHQEALAEFNDIQGAAREERMQCLQDRRFYSIAGAQWEGPLGDQFENKPRFEFNKVHLAVIRIFNEYRNNRITVDFQAKDGTKDDALADACDGLYRADYQACSGDEAVDNAFEEGAAGGVGAWRLRACYEDEDDDENDKQRIAFDPIFDADTCVFWNLGARRYDKADATRCYVLTPYPLEAYRAEFNDDPQSWPKAIQQSYFDWCTPDLVWVAELYRVEEKPQLVHFYRGLLGDDELRVTDEELEADPKMEEELLATGFRKVREKRIARRVVMKYTMSGGKIFDKGKHKPLRIAGRCIPIVPFYGKRWVVDGVERTMGHVRLAKDAQRLVNMLMSFVAEIASRFDIEKPVFSPEQIAGHAQMWAEDNVKKYPFLIANLLLDPTTGQPIPGSNVPVAYTKAPNLPPAVAALMQLAMQLLDDMLGNQQAGEEIRPNLSGKAVELIQQRLDMQTFIYLSNLAKSKKREGEIWLSMMRDIVVEERRKMKTVGANGEPGSVVVNQPMHDAETGEDYVDNDMTAANFDVAVDVGPSSSSQRSATVRALTGMMQLTQDPETLDVLSSLALMNMEGEGINDARQWSRRKLVRKGVVKPTEDELVELQQEAANAPPDPNAQFLQASAEEALANAEQSRAKTVQTIADADLKRAQTAKTLAETAGERNSQMIASAEALQAILQGQQQAQALLPPSF